MNYRSRAILATVATLVLTGLLLLDGPGGVVFPEEIAGFIGGLTVGAGLGAALLWIQHLRTRRRGGRRPATGA